MTDVNAREAVFRRERMPMSIDRLNFLFKGDIMTNSKTKKLTIAGVLCAIAVVGSLFSFPIFGSKCAPVQHMINILCATLLGPLYGLGVAFAASLLRNLLGIGTLMAFPGSIFGALLCGLVYANTKNIFWTMVGEVFGTGILGGLCAYPVAILFMGKSTAGLAFYVYIVPFLISTAVGAIISGIILLNLQKSGVLKNIQDSINK